MNMSVTTKMPTNCGMQGMHGNNVKKVAEPNTSNLKAMDNKQKMPTNCGMENMHQSNASKQGQEVNKIDVTPNIGKNLDVRV